MNTKNIKHFHKLDDVELSNYTGAGPVTSAIVSWLVLGTYDHIAKKATASCQQNPNQWHCVKF